MNAITRPDSRQIRRLLLPSSFSIVPDSRPRQGQYDVEQFQKLVGAVGIEPKAALKTCKFLALLDDKNAKNTRFAEVRYIPRTRNDRKLWKI